MIDRCSSIVSIYEPHQEKNGGMGKAGSPVEMIQNVKVPFPSLVCLQIRIKSATTPFEDVKAEYISYTDVVSIPLQFIRV